MLFSIVHFLLLVLLQCYIDVSVTVAATVSEGVHAGVMFCLLLLTVVSLYML